MLIQQLGGGDLLAGAVDVYPARMDTALIELTRTEFLRVMGADVPDWEVETILFALGFAPVRVRGTAAEVRRRPRGRAAARRGVGT